MALASCSARQGQQWSVRGFAVGGVAAIEAWSALPPVLAGPGAGLLARIVARREPS